MLRGFMRFFAFLIILLLIPSACSHKIERLNSLPLDQTMPQIPPQTNQQESPTNSGELRILALGDSYTIGEGAAVEDRWPVQLVERLRGEGLSVADLRIIARTGWTTYELSAAIDREDLTGPFDLVTLLIGVNNQYRGRSMEEYRAEFRDLLQRAIAFAGDNPTRVIVLSIPDWGVTPFAEGRDRALIAAQIDAFNQVNREETIQTGAVYVDITPISRRASAAPELLAADGLHPSGKMYAAWVDAVILQLNIHK
jgi:lysophospholipase L1-like esterase